jgi:hypothetical protein
MDIAHVVGSLAGCVTLAVCGIWLKRAEGGGHRPMAVLLPLTFAVVSFLVVAWATSSLDGDFGVHQPALLIVSLTLGTALGFVAGIGLSRDYYRRGGGSLR